MPVYVYKCNLCGTIIEKVRPVSKMKDTFACCECGDGVAEHTVARPARFLRGPQWNARIGVSMPGEVD